MSFSDGYKQGWFDAVVAMVDLVYAKQGGSVMAAQDVCLDHWRIMLQQWDGQGDPPRLERRELRVIDVEDV